MSPDEALARILTAWLEPLPEMDHFEDCPAFEDSSSVCICAQLDRLNREVAAEERYERNMEL